ncbi:hypothetical protein [Conexibacter woesei]|uniref:hypothetical protein n=1 Tax=Conexibacter woesei TaxID=191495 RepID=UPI0003FCFA47|nr:hypothetical protein [Conexibacter woesei]
MMLRTHAAAARTPSRLRRKALIGVATLSIAAASTATALAGADHYFSGTLVSGRGWAGSEAHSVTYIEGSGDHNGFCVAKDQGTTGYASATKTTSGTRACSSTGGFASRTEDGSCCYHGWVDNATGLDIIIATTTHTSY